MMKKIIAFSLALVMALGFTACGSDPAVEKEIEQAASEVMSVAEKTAESVLATEEGKTAEHTVQAIKDRGELIVATESQYAPFAFKNEKGEIIGLEPAFVQKMADDLGVKLTIMDIEFTAVVPAVQSGAADMALAGLSPTDERKKSVDMSDVYVGGAQCMIVRAEDLDTYPDATSLKGKMIVCQKGTLQQTLCEEQYPESELKSLPKMPQCVQELKAGNCAAVMMDEVSAKQYVKNNPDLAIGKAPVTIDPAEVGTAAALMFGNTDLLDFVNAEIKKYNDSGELAKWFEEAQVQAEKLGIE
ncbi:MAG: transporter substrate-binding domain-containing protein [Ruthenibacterium sp.]